MRSASRLVVVLVLLAGCARVQLSRQPKVPAGAEAVARQFLQLLAVGDVPWAATLLDPGRSGPGSVQAVVVATSLLRGVQPDSLVAVRRVARRTGGNWLYSIDYQTRTRGQWILLSVTVSQLDSTLARTMARQKGRAREPYAVLEMRAMPLPQSVQEANAFTLKGKSPAHYLILLFGAASLLFILYTIVQVFRTPGVRKWLWALVCLIAVGSLQLEWTTGQARFVGTAIILLGVSVNRPDLASSWLVQVGFPLGAALFYTRHMIHPFWRIGAHGQERRREEPPPGP